jgi:adenylate cyclase
MHLDPWLHWYPGRIEFLAGHYAEALAHFDAAVSTGPRWSAWRSAALAHLGRLEEARAEGERFVQLTAGQWHGDEPAGAADYCSWILDSTPLRCPADRERLREGLRLADLPA